MATALRQLNNDGIARATIKHFERYLEGLSQIINLDNPTRNEMFLLWHASFAASAQKRLREGYEKYGLPFTDYENLLMFRLREARGHGAIMQRMRM